MVSEKGLLGRMPVRAVLAALVGLAIALAVPASGQAGKHGIDVVTAVIFAAVAAVYVRQALLRRRQLVTAVYLELNKLRRLYHISKNLAGDSNRYRSWFTEVHGNLHMYLAAFEGGSLTDYSRNNPGFRNLSYHVYSAPELETEKEKVLYADLLKTTGTVAESRQRVKDLLMSGLTSGDWSLMLLTAAAAVVSVLATADTGIAGRLSAGLAIGAVLAGLDYVRNIDALNGDRVSLAARYVRNVSKLQYSREP
ncbi:hypothetical protein JW899_04580 [Candidatus Uhrbacteria bacterium]|nr:hypothetical protein [Candidatus Uhrbacteria bacterium]